MRATERAYSSQVFPFRSAKLCQMFGRIVTESYLPPTFTHRSAESNPMAPPR